MHSCRVSASGRAHGWRAISGTFVFYGKTPQALVQGRERIYLEHFWNDFAADPTKSIPEADRKIYAAEFARPNHVHAGMEYFRAIDQDGREFHEYAAKPLTMPMLVITGEKGARRLAHQAGGADRYGRAERDRARRRPLADGGSAGIRHSEAGGLPAATESLKRSHDSDSTLTRAARGDMLLRPGGSHEEVS